MKNELKVHKINASAKTLGRLSTEIVNLLTGKNNVNFVYNQITGGKVIVYNAEKIIFSGRKLEQKKYISHSGYLGNLKIRSLKELFKNKPEEIIRRAVYGMLPHNKLRKAWLKNLTIQTGNEKIEIKEK